jgi:hypothetical protein
MNPTFAKTGRREVGIEWGSFESHAELQSTASLVHGGVAWGLVGKHRSGKAYTAAHCADRFLPLT